MAGHLSKGYIEAIDPPHTVVPFMFNPSRYTISRAITYRTGDQKGVDIPETEFEKGEPGKLKLDLFVDEYESGGDAYDSVKKLEDLTRPHPANKEGANKPRPPRVKFGWGLHTVLSKAVITSLSVAYTLFHPDGRPARATISVDLQEVKDVKSSQNPTSGGQAGRRTHVVLPGETLDLIAYHELGDARYWQHIAEINTIDNPFAIRPGQSLVIAPVE